MKTLLIILTAFIGCQTQQIHRYALLIPNQIDVPIYKTYRHKEIKYYIKNDTLKEEYYSLEILEKKGAFFKVKTASAFNENEISKGWINSVNVGIYLRPRNIEEIIPIYKAPYENSNFINIDASKPEFQGLLNIIDIKGSWFKIKYTENGIIKEGWLKPDYQCPNAYSTCN